MRIFGKDIKKAFLAINLLIKIFPLLQIKFGF